MSSHPVLGVLGGMGPLASAEFLRTIYDRHPTEFEQDRPHVVLFSLPSIPDRTQSIRMGSESAYSRFVRVQVERLAPLCDRMVLACCTAHSCLPELPEALREKIVSLIDLVDLELEQSREPALLLASAGTYQRRLFHDGCRHADRLLFLSERDQQRCMSMAYDVLKKGREPREVLPWLDAVLDTYATRTIVSGCTEFHLVTRTLETLGRTDIQVIDPLSLVARDFTRLVRAAGTVPLFPDGAEPAIRKSAVPINPNNEGGRHE